MIKKVYLWILKEFKSIKGLLFITLSKYTKANNITFTPHLEKSYILFK